MCECVCVWVCICTYLVGDVDFFPLLGHDEVPQVGDLGLGVCVCVCVCVF